MAANCPCIPRRRERQTARAELIRRPHAIRKQGYAKADGEVHPRTRAIAASIFDHHTEVRAAVSLNGRIADAAWDEPGDLIDLVKTAAREISRRMWSTRRI